MFDALSGRLNQAFSQLRGKGRLSESDVNDALREVRIALLEADVNVSVVKSMLARVKERAVGSEVTKSLTPGQQVIKIVHEELIVTLGEEGKGFVYLMQELPQERLSIAIIRTNRSIVLAPLRNPS